MDAILEAWIQDHPGQDWQAHERAVNAEMERRFSAHVAAPTWLTAKPTGLFYGRDVPTIQRWAERGWLPTQRDLDGAGRETDFFLCDRQLRMELHQLHPVQRTRLANRALLSVAS